tara:strand:+ start:116 stop:481 length:366 start_codon:yes stop_codon:yes gene_type:complete
MKKVFFHEISDNDAIIIKSKRLAKTKAIINGQVVEARNQEASKDTTWGLIAAIDCPVPLAELGLEQDNEMPGWEFSTVPIMELDDDGKPTDVESGMYWGQPIPGFAEKFLAAQEAASKAKK